MTRFRLFVFVVFGLVVCNFVAPAAADTGSKENGEARLEAKCELLDDAKSRGKMDGLLKWLLEECGRSNELGQVRQESELPPVPGSGVGATDVQVNDSSGDGAGSTTQSETSIAVNPNTGTVCSGYNDSAVAGNFSGFSRSTDGGTTWDDRGSLPSGSSGDPSIVWRRLDGKFYYVSLRDGGLAIWRSDDDCQTFTFVSQLATGNDDKELMAIDNNPASTYYGRIYVAWTDFGQGAEIFSTYSSDGGATWSSQLAISGAGVDVQGAWPATAPNGDLYVAWIRWDPYPSGPITVEVVRSTNGGDSFTAIPSPMAGEVNPRDSSATSSCNRPALNGNIRYLPSPQIQVGSDGALHAVYSYDPDDFNSGDAVDVFYRKYSSANGGVPSWAAEVKLNDDATTHDQYFPNLSVGADDIVVVTFYDRRLSPTNLEQDTFKTVSPDGGATWLANERVSDVSTPIHLDPGLATCYHGDYDQIAQFQGEALLQWSDDRNIQNGHNDPDVWFEATPVSNDFFVAADPSSLSICAPDDAEYELEVLQFQGFSEPVTLSAVGEPAGTGVAFSVNPVAPPDDSVMTISNTGVAAPGSYSITVTGTSDPSAIVHDVVVGLNVFTIVPDSPELTSPADGAENVIGMPTFAWEAVEQAASYTFELATDVDFNNIVDAASGLMETTYSVAAALDSNTSYFWRVKADNICGDGGDSATWVFRTAPAPGDCSEQGTALQFYFNDFESGAAGWTHSAGVGPDTWALTDVRTFSGVNAFMAVDVAEVSDQYLVSPAIELPSDGAPLSLKYWNYQILEDSPSGCYDAGVLEISSNAGATWTRLENELLTDPYDGLIDDGFANPLANENGWCGDPEPWLESVVDIHAWAGQTVQFRFRLATDESIDHEGWYIDDFEIQSCGAIFADGFESGSMAMWSFYTF